VLGYGQNVFADKPWIVNRNDFSKLEKALELAKKKRLVTYDWMTLGGNAAYQLQRDLIEDESVFGVLAKGSAEQPAVRSRTYMRF
jgi:hypothetical protein